MRLFLLILAAWVILAVLGLMFFMGATKLNSIYDGEASNNEKR